MVIDFFQSFYLTLTQFKAKVSLLNSTVKYFDHRKKVITFEFIDKPRKTSLTTRLLYTKRFLDCP